MPQINDVQELMVVGLQDLFDGENKAVAAYPQLIQSVTNPQLKQAFEQHMQQSQTQADRLQQLAQQMGISAQGEECVAIQGLIQEAQKKVQMVAPGPVLDAALIGAAQKIEHLEIAGYGTARTLAQQLGQMDAVQVLEGILREEKATDEKLTQIAESQVNEQASQASGSSQMAGASA